MARIVGIDLPPKKSVETALTYLFGIGRTLSQRILTQTNIDGKKRVKDLTDEEIAKITQIIQNTYKIEGDLRREITGNIKRLIDIGAYRGNRHKRGLPVRGQRTRTNARTRKGPRPRVGVRKKLKPTSATAGART